MNECDVMAIQQQDDGKGYDQASSTMSISSNRSSSFSSGRVEIA